MVDLFSSSVIFRYGILNGSIFFSDPGQKFQTRAMASKRVAVKTVDWLKLGSTIPKAAAADFNAFRTRHETIKGSLESLPEKPAPIDWKFYQNAVKEKALVEKFYAAYSKVTVPYPEDTESAKIAAEEKQIEAEIVEAVKAKQVKISKLQEEIAKIRNQKPFEEMTTEEFMASHPDMKREVDAEIREIGWR
ncbi:ATP synthase subunit d, mitochondrial-like [Hydractinia symbiolongicarpus]|uniref:ATP synthase subunit d, mitochondrial-like n=1 Tax=Hydractinia symbiolongicarpus TaxID=13093 RepID=UPI00254B552C|nr:ATP synthase subunit d, mitochondrial-like [Hydractinia symbiolongicarpus]